MSVLAFPFVRPLLPTYSKGAEWAGVSLFALLWAALLRGPFFSVTAIDGDEALFAMIGKAWVAGHPPYTVIWDLKPPGLYLVYAAVSALFGDDLVGPKVACLVAVAATGAGLYAFAAMHLKSRPAGMVALALYAPATLVLDGLASKPDLMMAPFVTWGAVMTMASVRADESRRAGLAALGAGLLVGFAGMVKQTAVFETAWFLLVLAAARRPKVLWIFVAGGIVVPAGFVLWFASQGLLGPLLQASVLSAAQRIGGDGASLTETPARFAGMLKPVLPLIALPALLWAERRRLVSLELRRILRFIAGWLVASAVAALLMHATYPAYFLPLLPPLTLLSAVFLMLAPLPWPKARARMAKVAAGVLISVLYPVIYLQSSPDGRALRTHLPVTVALYLRREALNPGDSIYVIDYEPAVYLIAGVTPPTRFVLPEHLLCPFPGMSVSPAAEIARVMSQNPRCLVVSARRRRMACQDETLTRLPERLAAGRYSLVRRFTDGNEAVDVLCRPD